jgi:hypothetical protein
MMGRTLIVAALCAVITSSGGPASGLRYRRSMEAPSKGWMRVELDLKVMGKTVPDRRDLRVLGPRGEEMPFHLVERAERAEFKEAALTSVTPGPGGWTLLFDVGLSGAEHDRFHFQFGNRTVVSGCVLDGSADGETWRRLAQGDLFRAGDAAAYQSTTFAYAPTRDRYLRLLWPTSAGFPDVREAGVSTALRVLPQLSEEDLSVGEVGRSAGQSTYAIDLPGPGLSLQSLTPKWSNAGVVGYRLSAAASGRWITLAQGRLVDAGHGAWPSIPLVGTSLVSARLRLELWTGGETAAVLEGLTAQYVPAEIRFYAPSPGTYTLAYGGVGVGHPSYPEAGPPSKESYQTLSLGPEQTAEVPELPTENLTKGAAMPIERFAANWEIDARGVRPGAIVRLELPPELYEDARTDLGDIRVETDGKQIPYVLWSPPEPAQVASLSGVQPAPSVRRGVSQVSLKLPYRKLPLTTLDITAPAAPFERDLSVFYQDDSRPGVEEDARLRAGGATLRCEGVALVPCRLTLPMGPNPTLKLSVFFRDGDNIPLKSVSLHLWRRRDVVIFAWPPTGSARLRAGAPTLAPPRYDLGPLRDQLLARPFAPVTLAAGRGGAEKAGQPWVWRALVGAMALAGVVLLVILARMLKTRGVDPARRE